MATPKRNPFIPNMPTIGEQGVPGIDLTSWVAVVDPAQTPPEPVAKVNPVFVAALSDKQVHETIAKSVYENSPSTPEELATEIKAAFD